MQILASLGGTIHQIWFFGLGSGRFDQGHVYWHLIRNMCPRKITAVASSESIDIDWYWLDSLDWLYWFIDGYRYRYWMILIFVDIWWAIYQWFILRVLHKIMGHFSETFFGIATTCHLFTARYGALLSVVGRPPGDGFVWIGSCFRMDGNGVKKLKESISRTGNGYCACVQCMYAVCPWKKRDWCRLEMIHLFVNIFQFQWFILL